MKTPLITMKQNPNPLLNLQLLTKVQAATLYRANRIELDSIAFLGRNLEDYCRFLGLSVTRLQKKTILDCAAGASCFAAEAARNGIDALALDPLYSRKIDSLTQVAKIDLEAVMSQIGEADELFSFDKYGDVEQLSLAREQAMTNFLEDYPSGRANGRYVTGELPHLPYHNGVFDISVCGHFLFLYHELLDYDFHYEACRELCRVTREETRIYPLIGLDGRRYPQFNRLIQDLRCCGIISQVEYVDYEVMKGANEVLVMRREYAYT